MKATRGRLRRSRYDELFKPNGATRSIVRSAKVVYLVLLFLLAIQCVNLNITYQSILERNDLLSQLASISVGNAKESNERNRDSSHAEHIKWPKKNKASDTSAFCLLIKDDNDLLSEWIAYHYHVFNMRRLIVAVDPESKTTPLDVLENWGPSKGNFNLNFTIWTDDDYTPDYFRSTNSSKRDYSKTPNGVNASVTIENIENIPKPDRRKSSTLFRRIVKTIWHTNETYVAEHQEEVRKEVLRINDHRFRQKNFLSECYRQVFEEHPNSKSKAPNYTVSDKDAITWAVHIDTDEYLVINPWIGKYLENMQNGLAKHLKSILPSKPSEGSLWSFFRQFVSQDEDTRACVIAPRLNFGSKEVSDGTPATTKWESGSTSISWDHKNFESLRWKYHADYIDSTPPKCITNTGLMHKEDQIFSSKLAFSIHRPIVNTYYEKPGCKHQPLRVFNEYQFTEPLAVYHYLGSIEKYLTRNDIRRGVDTYKNKNDTFNYAKGDENNPNSEDARWWIGGWLENFVETHGGKKAYSVLGEGYATTQHQ